MVVDEDKLLRWLISRALDWEIFVCSCLVSSLTHSRCLTNVCHISELTWAWTAIDLISSYEIDRHLQAFWTWYSQICVHCWYLVLPLLPSGWTLQAEAPERQHGELDWPGERAREAWLLLPSFDLGFQPGCYKALQYLTFFPRGKWRTLI